MNAPAPTSTPPDRRTMSVSEAAAILGISRSTAYECIRTGALPALHFRRRLVVTMKTVEDLLRQGDIGLRSNGEQDAARSETLVSN